MTAKAANARSRDFRLSPIRLKKARAELKRFEQFCSGLRTTEDKVLKLQPFQRLALTPYFGGYPETLLMMPKGNGKTVLLAALAVYHLRTVSAPEVYIGASSGEQAQKMYREASRFARQVGLVPFPGYLEIRVTKDPADGYLRVLRSDRSDRGGLEGIAPTLGLVDELHAHVNEALYAAIQGALHKRDGRMVTISTAGSDEDTPLGRIRRNASSLPHVRREGSLTTATDGSFAMLEWSAEKGDDLTDLALVKAANPASFVTKRKLARIRSSPSMTDFRWARYHANVWTEAEEGWISAEEWDACEGPVLLDADEQVYLGVDIGFKRDSTAVVAVGWIAERLHVSACILEPKQGKSLTARDARLAIQQADDEYGGVEGVAYDPTKFQESAEELEELGFLMIEIPQTDSRMGPASETLYGLIRDRRLVHDGDPKLRSHILAAVASETERGWRLSKKKSKKHMDATVALAMAAAEAVRNQGAEEPLIEVLA